MTATPARLLDDELFRIFPVAQAQPATAPAPRLYVDWDWAGAGLEMVALEVRHLVARRGLLFERMTLNQTQFTRSAADDTDLAFTKLELDRVRGELAAIRAEAAVHDITIPQED